MPKLHFERRGAVAFVETDDQTVSIHLESAGVAVVVEGNVADIRGNVWSGDASNRGIPFSIMLFKLLRWSRYTLPGWIR